MVQKPSIFAGLAGVLLLGAVVAAVKSGDGEGAERTAEGAKPIREKGKKAGLRPSSRGRERTVSGREMRGMSALEAWSRLPAGVERGELRLLSGSKVAEEQAALFRRLGRLEGEAALDEIVNRYSGSGSYTAAAVVQAIVGWMEVDREGAIAAFRELITRPESDEVDFAPNLFCWKGTSFVSGFG